MRRLLIAALVATFGAVSGFAAAGCGGDDPAPLFADLQWELQCVCEGGCPGFPARDIASLNGEMGNRVSCLIEQSGDNMVMNWTAASGNDYGIRVSSAFFSDAGSIIGTGCRVTVTEDGTDYQAQCGSGQPSEVQPCRIWDIQIGQDMDGFPQLTGKLLCINMPRVTDQTIVREVTAPNAPIDTTGGMCAPAADTMAVEWRMVNCEGL